MKQLSIFNEPENTEPSQVQKKGRPHTLTPKTVFLVLEAIKKRLSNKKIINQFGISERTFYRIKKGDYDRLLKRYLNDNLNDFSLDYTD